MIFDISKLFEIIRVQWTSKCIILEIAAMPSVKVFIPRSRIDISWIVSQVAGWPG